MEKLCHGLRHCFRDDLFNRRPGMAIFGCDLPGTWLQTRLHRCDRVLR
jgi:hypothetical protein